MKSMKLPVDFAAKIKVYLQDDYSKFIESYAISIRNGIRINPKKHHPLLPLEGFEKIPWTKDGYFSSLLKLGSHPLHHAGAIYIQEPSAMAVVDMMDIQPDDVVLDVSSAPGSKATQIASYLSDDGLLIANEIDALRAQTLLSNIERMGVSQAIITQYDPDTLSKKLPMICDKILIDAPCSGEGMFRKDPNSVAQWSQNHVEMCSVRQKHILESVYSLLKPGGVIVYSTCTFSREENEDVIKNFLNKHQDFKLIKHHNFTFFNEEITKGIGVKLFPHEIEGDGHFIALLKKEGTIEKSSIKLWRGNTTSAIWNEFNQQHFINFKTDRLYQHKQFIYQLPKMKEIRTLHMVRGGSLLGEFKETRFIPSHHLAHILKFEQIIDPIVLTLDDPRLTAYLKGEEILSESKDGWKVVCLDRLPLGWGKVSQGRVKNHYPKGLRLL
jgi:NOL1/NOP2/sun family putative RNA methylase